MLSFWTFVREQGRKSVTQRLQQRVFVAKYVIVLCDDTRDLSKQRVTGLSNKHYIMRGWMEGH